MHKVLRLTFAALAVVSMTYGNLAALPQTNVVRLLAYSSIAQAGYFLLGVAALGRSDLAVRSLVVFAAAYAAMNVGAFAVALGEFGATVFVSRADWPTVPVAIFRFLGRPGADNVGTAMALSVVLMAVVTAVALLSERALVHGRPR